MINIQYWLMYHPYYDSECELGQSIRNAQKEGVPVDLSIMNDALIASGNASKSFPYLFSNTTDVDYREAQFVMGGKAVLYSDLKRYWSTAGDHFVDDLDMCAEYNNFDFGEDDGVVDDMALVKEGS